MKKIILILFAFINLLFAQNSDVTVNLMVLYTPAAVEWAENEGKLIDSLIENEIKISNLVMANSKTGVNLDLVHKQEINYLETDDVNKDLRRLSEIDDDFIDEVHLLRKEYQADLVALIVGNTTSRAAGAGYILNDTAYGGSPRNGFSVCKVSSLDKNFSFVHEIGHNFGCGHADDNNGAVLMPFSKGYHFFGNSGAGYSSIMAYTNTNYPTRIPYFSDPNILYDEVATGTENANNAETIRISKEIIAKYRNRLDWIDAFLREITISEGTLSPEFNPEIRNYTVTVGYETDNIDFFAKKNSSSEVKIELENDLSFDGQLEVNNKELAVGDNKFEIKTTTNWEALQKTYTVTVTRLAEGEDTTTSIKHKLDEKKFGILLEKTIVSDVAKISIITPEKANVNLKIYDNLGNLIFSEKSMGLKNVNNFVWNLRNSAGRFVANGAYLIVAETGKYRYSTKIGVKK